MHLQVMTDLSLPIKIIAPHQEVSYGALVFNTAYMKTVIDELEVGMNKLTASIVAPSVIVLKMKNATQ
jgi:hypothetical protein